MCSVMLIAMSLNTEDILYLVQPSRVLSELNVVWRSVTLCTACDKVVWTGLQVFWLSAAAADIDSCVTDPWTKALFTKAVMHLARTVDHVSGSLPTVRAVVLFQLYKPVELSAAVTTCRGTYSCALR